MATIHSLAPETLAQIFDYLTDDSRKSCPCPGSCECLMPSLFCAALVCRAWRDESQRALFETVFLGNFSSYEERDYRELKVAARAKGDRNARESDRQALRWLASPARARFSTKHLVLSNDLEYFIASTLIEACPELISLRPHEKSKYVPASLLATLEFPIIERLNWFSCAGIERNRIRKDTRRTEADLLLRRSAPPNPRRGRDAPERSTTYMQPSKYHPQARRGRLSEPQPGPLDVPEPSEHTRLVPGDAYVARARALRVDIHSSRSTLLLLQVYEVHVPPSTDLFTERLGLRIRHLRLAPRAQDPEMSYWASSRPVDYSFEAPESVDPSLQINCLVIGRPDIIWESLMPHCVLDGLLHLLESPHLQGLERLYLPKLSPTSFGAHSRTACGAALAECDARGIALVCDGRYQCAPVFHCSQSCCADVIGSRRTSDEIWMGWQPEAAGDWLEWFCETGVAECLAG